MDENEHLAMAADIKSRVSEFLDCFVVLGFTAEGERLSIAVSKTEMQSDALASLLGIVADDVNGKVRVSAQDDDDDDTKTDD